VTYMTEKELLELAENSGFSAKIIPTADVVIDYGFRRFCEDNLCGRYGANYSCPPDCGTPQQVHRRLLSKNSAMVLQKICEVGSIQDKEAVLSAKNTLNYGVLNLAQQIRDNGVDVIPLGYSGCPLCNPCKRSLNQPCAHPDKKISCLSAYCVDVAKLADRCKMEFCWAQDKLYLFGMVLFDK